MSKVIPSGQELEAWFFAHRTLSTITLLVQQLQVDRPTWLRMRITRQRLTHLSPTMVAFSAEAAITQSRDDIVAAMEMGTSLSCRMSGTNQRPSLEDIESRRDWYYQIYCDASMGDQYGLVNAFAALFAEREVVKGRVLIAKNGPEDGAWDPSIDPASLARTIWWYKRSGISSSSLAAQRDMERLLLAM
ncbi:hypothetical protein C8R44DRAFT_737559 [Mycena epipterygia]|nr:hypothetical protein C8R44DRAFT_737559 [Mycena epipterygia]